MTEKNIINTEKTKLWNENSGAGPVPVNPKISFPDLDHQVLKLWKDREIRDRSISERKGCPEYVTYDGPPGTNGQPHFGNIMQSALKDLWPRYFTMKGYQVLRKAGWDTHGLPVELTAEKELGLKTKRDIIEYGVERYIDYCRKTVFRYKDAWTNAIQRIGRFLDTDNYYATLTKDYIQTDWWVLKQAWEKDLLYQGHKIMPYCHRCGTSLSAHETAQGYKDVKDISLYVKFPVAGKENTYFIAWTTTAWTLLSNVALAVNPDLTYVTIEVEEEKLIVAEARLEALKEMLGDYKVIEKHVGKDFKDDEYKPLWDFQIVTDSKAHYVIVDDYVTAEDGTGIVHLALYGEDDFRLIKKNNLPIVQNVNEEGRCRKNVKPFAGSLFSDEGLDIDILKDLAGKGLLFGKKKIEHPYPHCYRCDERLMYFATSSWFIRTSSFKNKMLKANEDINWYPNHIKRGRFGNWLENNVDWAISRSRYWGSPLPIWTCKECDHQICAGSLQELEELKGEPLPDDFDPHKPYIDRFELPCTKCNGVMKRVPEVLDSWYNAGIMPWGQWGYPAKEGSDKIFENQYPADFICEAIDQTRGWFYTMLAISTMLTDKSSYKNVICTELIAAEDGSKMSKSRGNVVDPIELCDKYGADAVRLGFYTSNPWIARRFNESELSEGLKQVIIPYWNAYSFFVTYARVDNWQPDETDANSNSTLDRWILSRLEWLRTEMENALEGYDVAAAAEAMTLFIDELTNWYIRRSRRRFWKSEDDLDKAAAYDTLYKVLCDFNIMLAPFLPFITETIFQNLSRAYNSNAPDSVHLSDWPSPNTIMRDAELEEQMALTREIVSSARSLRNEGGLRVRQPLSEIIIHGVSQYLTDEMRELVLDELNIKQLKYVDSDEELFSYSAKADFKTLGPKLGKEIKIAAETIAKFNDAKIRQILNSGKTSVNGVDIQLEDLIISKIPPHGFWIHSVDGLTIAIDHRIDENLYNEWLAREFVHHVQNQRKKADLDVTQRIDIKCNATTELSNAVMKHEAYIKVETLSLSVEIGDLNTIEELTTVGDQSCRTEIKTVN